MEPIDMDDDSFKESEWIGKGRLYPKDTRAIPLGLATFCDARRKIPDDVEVKYVPGRLITVKALVESHLPRISFRLALANPQSCFSKLTPHENLNIDTATIPSLEFVTKLDRQFNQAVLDDMKSIENPEYPGLRLPLWVIGFWKKMHKVSSIQQEWKSSLEWLDEHLQREKSVVVKEKLKEAKKLVHKLRWNEVTNIPGGDTTTTTFEFSSYLSNNRMMDRAHINMMFAYLADRAQADKETDTYVVIEGLRFILALGKVFNGEASMKFLRYLEEKIKNDELPAIVFPAYVEKEKHWVAIRIDFESEEICFGDSLAHKGMKPSKPLIKIIQHWLKKRVGKEYKNTMDSLAHGNQEDWTDCGILAANTIAHDVFHDPLWAPSRKIFERLSWFVQLSNRHIEYVNESNDYTPYDLAVLEKSNVITPNIANLLNPMIPTHGSVSKSTNVHSDTDQAAEERTSCDKIMSSSTPLAAGTEPDSESMEEVISQETEVVHVEESKKRRATVSVSDPNPKPPKVSKSEEYASTHAPKLLAKMSERFPGRLITKSTLWAKIQNLKFANGDLDSADERFLAFKETIMKLDSRAVIKNAKLVRHFKCGKDHKMKGPFNTANFKTHVASCDGPPKSHKFPTGGMAVNPLDAFFKTGTSTKSKQPSSTITCGPCPGLSEQVYPEISTYLDRTGALGGGGDSVSVIAHELFGKKYIKLNDRLKQDVKTHQIHTWKWRNNHDNRRIHSTKCLKTVPYKTVENKSGQKESTLSACASCVSILSIKSFKSAIKVELPSDENYKYLNVEYRHEKLAVLYGRCTGLREIIEDKTDKPLIRYCKGVVSGKYKGNDVFGLLLQAVVVKQEKEARGVGMQNFKYAPDLVEFAHIIHTHSPKAFDSLREFLPLPNPRTLKLHRSRQPRFPCGIQERTFSFVINKLQQLQYNGPVALSCDDTKLLASLRPYYDYDREGYYVMGHVGQPIEILDYEAFRRLINEGKLVKATKLRLWCIQVPEKGIATFIAAAVAIPETLSAEDLLSYLWEMISGFLDRGVKISSYVSDGSTVERSTQRLLEAKATSTTTITIPHPHEAPTASDYIINIRFYGSQPIATIQDPKHLLKTFRNNLYSGARLLTFPTKIATFSQVRQISHSETSPIYIRDVEKADRQDDNAATRLFSGATLEWLITNQPDHLGLIIYLFICGELIDAYQNRFLSLVERVQLVLRAHYFIDLWDRFLVIAKYPKARHFISPQCVDITRTLIQGFLQALIIYRDFSGGPRPFLPWLLATEVIEHVFGICRQIVKDFTMLDFHNMVPKLFIQLRQAALSSKFTDGKATASGYNHTYTDTRGIDIQALSSYPSNSEIQRAAVRAYGEAESLFSLLGGTPSDLYVDNTLIPTRLPSIRSWFQDSDYVESLMFTGTSIDSADDSDSDDSDNEGVGQGLSDYQQAMDSLEDADDNLSCKGAETLMSYRYASIALTVEEHSHIASLPEPSDSDIEEALSEDAERIAATLSECGNRAAALLPPIVDNHPINPFDSVDPASIDLSTLSALRFSHQTKQAETGVRTSHQNPLSRSVEGNPSPVKVLSERQQILRGFAEILREQGDQGVGTGLERSARWRNSAPGGNKGHIPGAPLPELAAGNSVNAAAMADSVAKRALIRRKDIINKAELPSVIGEARVSILSPLKIGDYGIAISPTLGKLVVCKVLELYSKSTGKGSRHSAITDSSSITAISNIAIQVYECQFGTSFRNIPHTQSLPNISRFDLIQSSAFMCTLMAKPKTTENGIKISVDDWSLFKQLVDNNKKVMETLKVLVGRAKATTVEEGDD